MNVNNVTNIVKNVAITTCCVVVSGVMLYIGCGVAPDLRETSASLRSASDKAQKILSTVQDEIDSIRRLLNSDKFKNITDKTLNTFHGILEEIEFYASPQNIKDPKRQSEAMKFRGDLKFKFDILYGKILDILDEDIKDEVIILFNKTRILFIKVANFNAKGGSEGKTVASAFSFEINLPDLQKLETIDPAAAAEMGKCIINIQEAEKRIQARRIQKEKEQRQNNLSSDNPVLV